MSNKKVVVVAPFWSNPQHIGVCRLKRFVRWLRAKDIDIVLVRAGRSDNIRVVPWGYEITVKDPLGLYGDSQGGIYNKIQRRPNYLRRWAADLIFNPDPSVVWAKRAARHSMVLEHGQGAGWVISSSPPESSHLASYILAAKLKADLVVDLRDGWLDEPLKPLLQKFVIQCWREGLLEKKILGKAKKIFVTSEVWKGMLEIRLPLTRGKITILTNGYPPEIVKQNQNKNFELEDFSLLYAGRFRGSRNTQKVGSLLQPLLAGTKLKQGKIILMGSLEHEDLEEAAAWEPLFEQAGWALKVCPSVSREEMYKRICRADGLLLLCIAQAAIPSKLYDYLPSGRPILAVTYKGSALWQLCQNIPQVFLLDCNQTERSELVMESFFAACSDKESKYPLPPDFSESRLAQIFYDQLGLGHDGQG